MEFRCFLNSSGAVPERGGDNPRQLGAGHPSVLGGIVTRGAADWRWARAGGGCEPCDPQAYAPNRTFLAGLCSGRSVASQGVTDWGRFGGGPIEDSRADWRRWRLSWLRCAAFAITTMFYQNANVHWSTSSKTERESTSPPSPEDCPRKSSESGVRKSVCGETLCLLQFVY